VHARTAAAQGRAKHPLVSAFALAVVEGPAWGYDYTMMCAPPACEDSHLDIADDIYSAYGPFVDDGLDFNNGRGIAVSSVYDFNSGDETIRIMLGDETDVDQNLRAEGPRGACHFDARVYRPAAATGSRR
jgi:hypothetical protein